MSATPQHSRRRRFGIILLIAIGLLLIGGLLVGLPLLQTLTRSFTLNLPLFPTATPYTGTAEDVVVAEVGERLHAVGLAESDYLLSTGVTEHLERLRAGVVSPDALRRYADNLAILTETTAGFGESIPVQFWDVETTEMRGQGITEYSLVEAMAAPESEPYLSLLARSYNRLVAFHLAAGDDTALDAALDIFHLVIDYYEQVAGKPADDSASRVNFGNGAILVWQQVMFSTSRDNPLTGKRLISHSFFNRFNITSMWRYRNGENIWLGKIWGVTGFAPRFVGVETNDNQVEHMTISMTLQMVLGNPVSALNMIEYRDVLTGRSSDAEANADISVNNAISRIFAPRFRRDYREAIEVLRCALAERDSC